MFDLVTKEGLSRDRTYIYQEQDSWSAMFRSHAPELEYSSQDCTGGGASFVPYRMKKSTCGITIMACTTIQEDCISMRGHPVWGVGFTLPPDFDVVPFVKVLMPVSVSGLTTLSFPTKVTLWQQLR